MHCFETQESPSIKGELPFLREDHSPEEQYLSVIFLDKKLGIPLIQRQFYS